MTSCIAKEVSETNSGQSECNNHPTSTSQVSLPVSLPADLPKLRQTICQSFTCLMPADVVATFGHRRPHSKTLGKNWFVLRTAMNHEENSSNFSPFTFVATMFNRFSNQPKHSQQDKRGNFQVILQLESLELPGLNQYPSKSANRAVIRMLHLGRFSKKCCGVCFRMIFCSLKKTWIRKGGEVLKKNQS